MATQTAKQIDDAHFDATANALNTLTDEARDHPTDPKNTLHKLADHEKSHNFLKKFIPYQSLQEAESAFHMGNYVLDRRTGKKEWEPMSIYVRVGMHALYYGSEQEKALHWKRTVKLLEDQSVKMGKQYDSPESVDHIQPFLESFKLQDTMKEMVQPDPTKYKNFNDFFAREIREDARPPAEPQDVRIRSGSCCTHFLQERLANSSPMQPFVVSSVADCRITTFPTIDLATKYWIKGFGFSVAKLLKSESLAQQYTGGSIAIARLAPQDYHRWHAPVDGIVESITEIPGAYYTVNPQAINEVSQIRNSL